MPGKINPKSGAHAVRLALLEFDAPNEAPAEMVCDEALKIWKKAGSVGAAPHIQTVYQARHELRLQLGELTREGIRAYMSSFGWDPEGQEAPAPARPEKVLPREELPSFASVVRAAMTMIPEGERTDYVRVLAVARARWANLGGDPNSLTPMHVRNTAYHVRKHFGDLSDKALRDYGALDTARSHARGGRKSKGDAPPDLSQAPPALSGLAEEMKTAFNKPGAPEAQTPTAPSPEASPWDLLRKAKQFVDEAGGASAARDLIALLEELSA